MPKVVKLPENIRPFTFHGVELSDRGEEWVGTCPFCGREEKLYVQAEEGLWECKVCAEKGNPLTFLRLLWKAADEATGDYAGLAKDRGLLYPETLLLWGIARSPTMGEWLVPSYSPDGRLVQLYQWLDVRDHHGHWRKAWLPTPTFGHPGMFLPRTGFDRRRGEVFVAEGVWDAMTLWESLRVAKRVGDGLERTGNEESSLLAGVNVIATPTAQVFPKSWATQPNPLNGKRVTLFPHNDHDKPHPQTGKLTLSAGYAGARKTSELLLGEASEVVCLRWHQDALIDVGRKDGYDVRDHLTGDFGERLGQLADLLKRVDAVPEEWLRNHAVKSSATRLHSSSCKCWDELLDSWCSAMEWTAGLDHALPVMLAVAASTSQSGDQLFLQVIGSPGCGKTRLCDAMLVSQQCFALEHVTGFYSGWKGDGGEDYSLLSRINHKTLITPEGDVLLANPKFAEIMSQQRRIFDGSGGASYKNRKDDQRYTGLRTPWIVAGTQALLNMDQSRLGDRFLRVFVNEPGAAERRSILRHVVRSALTSVRTAANGVAESVLEGRMAKAYALTGGYVDYLREHAGRLLDRLDLDEERLGDYAAKLAEFVALMRARPESDLRLREKGEVEPHVEMPTRLTHQFVRLACCLAVVLQRPAVDDVIFERLRRVAIDTSGSRVLKVCKYLSEVGVKGMSGDGLATLCGQGAERKRHLLRFLRGIGCVEFVQYREPGWLSAKARWRLTPRVADLYREIVAEEG